MTPEKQKNKKGAIIFSLLCVIIVIGVYNSWKDEISLNSNKKMTIGRITDFKYSSRHGYIDFKFYADGKLYNASDPDDSGWPKYVRKAKAIKYRFYPVEYEITNPNNSKILITKNPLEVEHLLKKGIKIQGEIENIFPISDSYVDLHIKYIYLKGSFKFRTRLHKDSLPCGTIDNCRKSKIDLVISKDYPDINSLYYQSYDRRVMKKVEEKRK